MREISKHISVFTFLIALVILCNFPDAYCAQKVQPSLANTLQSIEHELEPHRGELGKREGIKAIESAEKKLEPLLKKYSGEIKRQASLMSLVLQIAAVFCDIDPTYYSIEFLFEFKNSQGFSPALKNLPQADHKCIEEGLSVLNENSTEKTGGQ